MNPEYLGDTVEEALRVYDFDKRNKTFKLKNYLCGKENGAWYRFKEDNTIIYDFMSKGSNC